MESVASRQLSPENTTVPAEVTFQSQQSSSMQTIFKSRDKVLNWGFASQAEVSSIEPDVVLPREKYHYDITKTKDQYGAMFLGSYKFAIKSGEIIKRTWQSDLDRVPEIKSLLSELDIDEKKSKDIFCTWTSFDGVGLQIYPRNPKKFKLKNRHVIRAMPDQLDRLVMQTDALVNYANEYGSKELNEIIDNFGIHNFDRYESRVLHEQLEQWKTGAKLPVNVVLSAHTDWNGAYDRVGNDYARLFGDDCLFFEIGGHRDLAKAAISIGNHERNAGRDPRSIDPFENIIINAHGEPRSLSLGYPNSGITVEHYYHCRESRHKIGADENDYSRHLGSNYRVILRACRTAAQNPDSEHNIAEIMSDEYGIVVKASKFITSSILSVGKTGEVVFRTHRKFGRNQIPSTTYWAGIEE